MQGMSLHCMAVTESLSYCVHHYNRSTSAGIFTARLHKPTSAIFCSCQLLNFDGRPIYFWTLGIFGVGPTNGASPRPLSLRGASTSRNADLFPAIFGRFLDANKTIPIPVFSSESNSSWWTVSKMTYILISYLGEFSRYSGSKFSFEPFFRLFVKMAAFTSESNFSSSTL